MIDFRYEVVALIFLFAFKIKLPNLFTRLDVPHHDVVIQAGCDQSLSVVQEDHRRDAVIIPSLFECSNLALGTQYGGKEDEY